MEGDTVAHSSRHDRTISDNSNIIAPGLYVVATPIGNLGDISQRALKILAAADVIACEDTRTSLKLLTHYGIRRPLFAYHEHNAVRMAPRLLEKLAQGASVALISDAGTPLISDPGYRLVAQAQEAGYPVMSIPGPSAFVAALSICGLPTDRVLFLGFAPSKQGARQRFIEPYADLDVTLALYESPNRIVAALRDYARILGPRKAAVCRELTKSHEEVRRGSLVALADAYEISEDAVRGEIVLVIGPPEVRKTKMDIVDAVLRRALKEMPVKEAARTVAFMTGEKKRVVYQRALALKDFMGDS